MSIDERLTAAGLPTLPRGVWLEIDEAALANNLRVVRELVGTGVAINAVVKADAYGHGLVPVARVFEAAGADRLCVASLDEALLLRGAGVQSPILILFPVPPAEVARAAQARFEIVAAAESSTLASLAAWTAAQQTDGELKVHLEIETGLSRGGLKPSEAARLARRIVDTPRTSLASLWSHLASPESESATAAQVEQLEAATAEIGRAGLSVPARHMAATGGLFTGRAPLYEGVRPGLALYGLLPDDLPIADQAIDAAKRLVPAMSIRCRALRVERLSAGTSVGYGGRWTAARESVIATLPIGYGDGFVRAYSPGAEALVCGQRVPLVGTVAMDAVMADVTDVPGVGSDDEFVLIGEQNGARIVTNELARGRTTIPWEVVTNMAYRIPRVYHAGSVLLGLRTLNGEARINDVGLVD
ncbi:MAG TPA: alanine racemase [Candidatus Limnocylindrales bacterium]|nr:alanine racemase [Candidatus Limnocylindrales bacterium]